MKVAIKTNKRDAIIRHANNGNCWAVVKDKKCPECGMTTCDVCHEHDEPRGECSECKQCAACAAEKG